MRQETATVVSRLDEAGAVLAAKLTLGALAWGDVWFGGKTRNPWNPEEGSRGSSAGSAAAVAAGLVGFAIGTETRGSILSPCTRCGATGLRLEGDLVSHALEELPVGASGDEEVPVAFDVVDRQSRVAQLRDRLDDRPDVGVLVARVPDPEMEEIPEEDQPRAVPVPQIAQLLHEGPRLAAGPSDVRIRNDADRQTRRLRRWRSFSAPGTAPRPPPPAPPRARATRSLDARPFFRLNLRPPACRRE